MMSFLLQYDCALYLHTPWGFREEQHSKCDDEPNKDLYRKWNPPSKKETLTYQVNHKSHLWTKENIIVTDISIFLPAV